MKRLTVMVLGLAGGAILALAPQAQAATALTGRIISRPLTPGDLTRAGLPSTMEVSGGLSTVAVGTPVYLEADVNIALAPASITNVTFTLTGWPIGSVAALAPSPLGTNLPVYEPSDRLVYQAAGRALLRTDLPGQYTIQAAIGTTSGSTNVSLTLTAGTYLGASVCEFCHSGGFAAPDKYKYWTNTAHASIFTEGIQGLLGSYSSSCLKCHTVGYDTNTNAVNGGFDDIAKQDGWTFPTNLTTTNWTLMPANLQNVANIQCENCHGPGSQHFLSFGNTNMITKTVLSGDCNQCHDAPTHHIKGTEWDYSVHAVAVTTPSGAGREACVGCHTASGFIGRINGDTTTNTVYSAIGCQACHEPHGETTPANNIHLLRTQNAVTFQDGTTVTNFGESILCINCHQARQNATNYVATTAGGGNFGPHHGTQGDMFFGINAITYGQVIPSAAHRDAITNACVTCHMQATATTDPSFLLAGGHTWRMTATNNGVVYPMTAACQQCHGNIKTFDFPREDYDGNGLVEGVQTEVQNLMNNLAALLPPVGTPKTSISTASSWTKQQLNAAYNYSFVYEDRSKGVHNVAYAVGLLKASINDLTGGGGVSSVPAAWQIQYFGSTTNPAAAAYASGSGDGVPNWLKYSLGVDPTKPGLTVPGGVVWTSNNTVGGSTNTIQLYTAAEIAFNTVAGTTYQIQGIATLGGGWQTLGTVMATNTGSFSYLTKTRGNGQQFFRVVHAP